MENVLLGKTVNICANVKQDGQMRLAINVSLIVPQKLKWKALANCLRHTPNILEKATTFVDVKVPYLFLWSFDTSICLPILQIKFITWEILELGHKNETSVFDMPNANTLTYKPIITDVHICAGNSKFDACTVSLFSLR